MSWKADPLSDPNSRQGANAPIPCCERDYDGDGNCDRHPNGRTWNQDLQRYEDEQPEGGTATRSPFPGWLRNYGNGWLGRVNPREFKAAILNHIRSK